MTTAEYWRDRAEMVMQRGMDKADVVLRDLQKMYAQAARDVQAEIDKLYRMYAQESGLSYADAQAYLNRAERTEWRMTLAEYVDRINATGDKALLAELNALAAQSRVRRFRQVLTAIDVAASELRSGGEKLTEKLLRGTYRSAYRMAGDLLAGGTLEALNPASVAQALAYPWSGASFSDRIWSNAEQLAQTLRRTVTQGLIQGQDVRQMAAGVQKATDAAMHRAETLIRTETARWRAIRLRVWSATRSSSRPTVAPATPAPGWTARCSAWTRPSPASTTRPSTPTAATPPCPTSAAKSWRAGKSSARGGGTERMGEVEKKAKVLFGESSAWRKCREVLILCVNMLYWKRSGRIFAQDAIRRRCKRTGRCGIFRETKHMTNMPHGMLQRMNTGQVGLRSAWKRFGN